MILRNYDIYSIEERVHDLEMGGSPTPGGSGEIYTETETKIGTFMGADLYRIVKTVPITEFTANTSMVVVNASDISSLNIDCLVRAFCVLTSSATTSPHGTVTDSFWIDGSGNIKVKPYSGYINVTDCKLVIEYTKTTQTKKSRKKGE